jgi:hypothetical protein
VDEYNRAMIKFITCYAVALASIDATRLEDNEGLWGSVYAEKL